MKGAQLFEALDWDGDGLLSRNDLRSAARRLGWQWPHARLYAVLDRLTVEAPLSAAAFLASLECMADDPLGPFGQVLLRAPGPPVTPAGTGGPRSEVDDEPARRAPDGRPAPGGPGDPQEGLSGLLAQTRDRHATEDYQALLRPPKGAPTPLSVRTGVLLVIDPQRSFTLGSWAQSMGPNGAKQIAPIAIAFDACAQLLQSKRPRPEAMFTRCPFPPDSYDWHEPLQSALPPDQRYFVKPGNSVRWPPTNGFDTWTDRQLASGRTTLVMGGCTLNSCVRVSAIETQDQFGPRGLQVVVDLSLCGARMDNYLRSAQFGNRSSVATAVRQMRAAGVTVTAKVSWQH